MRRVSTIVMAVAVTAAAQSDARLALAERVRALTRESPWTLVAKVPIAFTTYHPQGMVKIGDTFVVSSVEVHDRAAGKGVGHLFKIDNTGTLLAHATLTEGAMYHPGGLDYDGRNIWVPLAEYRPDSHSIVYRVDPQSLKPTEMFRVADSIGAIVRNTDDDTVHGVSWGSRRFYRWTIGPGGEVTTVRTLNTSHYIDYQDCKYAGARRMLCTGLAELTAPGGAPFRLGGIDLVDLADGRPLHQVPVPLWTPSGLDMTHNPVWLEPSAAGLRGYFMPEDNSSTLYIYETR